MSYRDFTNLFLAYSPSDSVELKLRSYLKIDQDDIMWDKLVELDLFNPNKKVTLKNATPAQILQRILMDSWSLEKDDKDMIVMYHKFGYEIEGEKKQIESNMVVVGEDQTYGNGLIDVDSAFVWLSQQHTPELPKKYLNDIVLEYSDFTSNYKRNLDFLQVKFYILQVDFLSQCIFSKLWLNRCKLKIAFEMDESLILL